MRQDRHSVPSNVVSSTSEGSRASPENRVRIQFRHTPGSLGQPLALYVFADGVQDRDNRLADLFLVDQEGRFVRKATKGAMHT